MLLGARAQAFRRYWQELKRRLTGRRHTLHVFLELDDPYSYLLSLYVPDLARRYDVEVCLHLANALREGFRPRADLLAIYAEADCRRLAAELNVPFLDKGAAPPVELRRTLIDTLAAAGDDRDKSILEALSLYWRGDAAGVARRLGDDATGAAGDAMLQHGQDLLVQLGHYDTATIYYAGEWYRGVERLHYLCERLDSLQLRTADAAPTTVPAMRQLEQVTLPVSPPGSAEKLPPLEFFFSFRSPYSYFAMQRVFALADAFGLDLQIRPVLPMVMRGMPVPAAKLRYIASDAFREARRLGIDFGKFADPVGSGVERCMAVFYYALGEKKARDFMLNAATAIWAEGVNVATDKGLRKITGRTGLFWPDVRNAVANDDWRELADENRASLTASGSWGVPTLRMGEFTVWGQDRIWLLVRHIEEQCDAGEGILI